MWTGWGLYTSLEINETLEINMRVAKSDITIKTSSFSRMNTLLVELVFI